MNRFRVLAGFPREVKVITVAGFIVAVGFGVIVPAMPLFAKSFGVSNSAVGLIVSMFAIARFATGMFSGKFVDRFGERLIFVFGIFAVSLSTLLAALAQNYTQLLIFRTAGGFGSSMFSVAASSIIMRSVSDDQRGRALSVYNASFLMGGIAGPGIGGLLTTISLRAPFFTYAITLFIAGTIGYFFLNKGKADVVLEKSSDEKTTLRQALKMSPYRTALIVAFVANWVLIGMRSSILPLFVIEQLHSTTSIVGLGFTLTALFQGILLLPAGTLSDLRGRRLSLSIGSTVIWIGSIMLIFTNQPWMFLLAMCVTGVGGGFLSTVPANIVGDVITGKSGQVIALWQMAGDAGMIVGPIAVGYLSDAYSFRSAFIFSAAAFSIAVWLSYRLPETRRSHLEVVI